MRSELAGNLDGLIVRLEEIEQILSRPPQATRLPDSAKAQVITHEERSGMA
jgi:hypothetical protein